MNELPDKVKGNLIIYLYYIWLQAFLQRSPDRQTGLSISIKR